MTTPVLPGWKRLSGSSRNYVNTRTGEVLPRRQYDKLVVREGKRRRERAERLARQTPLQRQYNALLESYVRNQRAQGNLINKKQSRESADFKRAIKMIRTKRPVNETVMHREARQQARRMGLDIVGGDDFFRRVYNAKLADRLDEADELDEAA